LLALVLLGIMVSPAASFSPDHKRVTTTASSQRSLSSFGLVREEHEAPGVILYSDNRRGSETGNWKD
jgi:hypothetical protein